MYVQSNRCPLIASRRNLFRYPRQGLIALIIVGESLARSSFLLRKILSEVTARTTKIRWRNSSSTSPGMATACDATKGARQKQVWSEAPRIGDFGSKP
jgi:hypothetical protein